MDRAQSGCVIKRDRHWLMAALGAASISFGCATPSTEIAGRSEIYETIPSQRVVKIAVFSNWHDSCAEGGCQSNKEKAQTELASCLSAGMQLNRGKVEVVDPGYLLREDTSALIDDPRISAGMPDSRFTPEMRDALIRTGAQYALLVDLTTSRGEVRVTPKSGFGSTDGVPYGVVGTHNQSAVYTSMFGTLVDLSNGKWVARIRRNFAGSAESGSGIGFILVIPVPLFHSKASTTERSACVSMGSAIESVVIKGAAPSSEWETLNRELMSLFRQGEFDRAIAVAERALSVALAHAGGDNLRIAASLNNLADLFRRQDRYSEAELLYQSALTIREKTLGPDHPDVGRVLINLAALYRKTDRESEAVALEKRAAAIEAIRR